MLSGIEKKREGKTNPAILLEFEAYAYLSANSNNAAKGITEAHKASSSIIMQISPQGAAGSKPHTYSA
jgi:hypothetical protein